MPDDWSTPALKSAVANGLLNGIDGKILPNSNLTRAQMATIIVRAFGASVNGDISAFSDIKPSDWFAGNIAKAYQMGIIKGAEGKMNPTSAITREEVFVILARALKLTPSANVNKHFSDIEDLSSWAKGETFSLINSGYINGSDGYLLPRANITRAEFAQIMYNIVTQYYNTAGTYTTASSGSLMINTPGVTLQNITVTGDLIIGDGVGDGDVTLENVAINGRLVIRGGGENSIIIRGSSSVSNVVVAREDGVVSVKVQGDANVDVISIEDGSDDVRIEGSIGTVEVIASGIEVTATSAAINSIKIKAADSKVIVGTDATVKTLEVESAASGAVVQVMGTVTSITTSAGGTQVTGPGSVNEVRAREGSAGSGFQTSNTKIVVDSGVTGVTGAGGAVIKSGSTETNNATGTWIKTNPLNDSGNDYVTSISITSLSPVAGPVSGGTSVVITGVDLTRVTAVTFGGVAAASYTIDTATQITAVSPAHAAGVVDVVVTTPGGTATGTGAYTYAAIPVVTSLSPTVGPVTGSSTVTITGTDFTGATAVYFDGTAAISFTVDSATQITAIAPVHAAGTAQVTVTTAGGTSTSTASFTYYSVPTFTSLSPISGPTMGGLPVIITGANFTGTTEVTFDGIPAMLFVVTSATQITAIAPAHAAGPVDVVVTTPGGTATSTSAYTYGAVFGYSYQLATIADATILGYYDVPFSNNGPLSEVSHDPGTTTFTVFESGEYLINYGVSVASGMGSAIAIAVNGTVVPSTAVSAQTAPGEIKGTAVLILAAGDIITLRNNSSAAFTLAADPSVGAQLSLMKVNANADYAYELASSDNTVASYADVPLNNNGVLNSLNRQPDFTSFFVSISGYYLINYIINYTDGVGASIGIAVTGVVDLSTVTSVQTAAGKISGSAVLYLAAGDVISLRNDSPIELALPLAPSVGAQMTCMRVDASYFYELAASADHIVAGGSKVSFSENGSINAVINNSATEFIVMISGYYLINYKVSYTNGLGSSIGIAVNGDVDRSTVTSAQTATGEITGSVVQYLMAGDTVSLINSSSETITLTTDPSVGAQMSFVKVS